MEHGLYLLPFDQAEIIEEIHSSEDSSSEVAAGPGKVMKKKQKWSITTCEALSVSELGRL